MKARMRKKRTNRNRETGLRLAPRLLLEAQGNRNRKGTQMAKRKYDPERLRKAAADWDVHHALVAAVRRLVKLAGGVQEAKDVIDAIAAADALEEEKDESR
jgi:hypothetical protein